MNQETEHRAWSGEPAPSTLEDRCPRCSHPEGPHTMMAPGGPLQGGVMLCPEGGCTCFGTWSVPEAAEPAEAFCGFCESTEHRAYQHLGLDHAYVQKWLENASGASTCSP